MSLPLQPLAGQWRGVNRRVAPHLLGVGESPEAVNCGHRQGRIGILGPRLGRTKANTSPFAGTVVGLIPFELPGDNRLLVGSDDGGAVTVIDEPGLFPYAGGGAGGTWPAPSGVITIPWAQIDLTPLTGGVPVQFPEGETPLVPINLAIPIANFGEAVCELNAAVPQLSIAQANADDEGNAVVDLQLAFDGGGLSTWMTFYLDLVAGGCYGYAAAFTSALAASWASLKAGATLLTQVGGKVTLTRTNGAGPMTGEVCMAGSRAVLIPGSLGASY
jgi:hypothetical protein